MATDTARADRQRAAVETESRSDAVLTCSSDGGAHRPARPVEAQPAARRCPGRTARQHRRRHQMPTVSNVVLTLTTVSSGGADQVKIKVEYDVEFSTFERQLVALGLSYDTHVTIHDFDGGDTPGDQILDFYPGRTVLGVTVGTGYAETHRHQGHPYGQPDLAPGRPDRGRRRAEGLRPGPRQRVDRGVHARHRAGCAAVPRRRGVAPGGPGGLGGGPPEVVCRRWCAGAQPAGSSTATASRWWVIGNRSYARRLLSR